jgi:hypothetical protein
MSFAGNVPVPADTFAFFYIGGPSAAPKTLAKWDSLLFKDIPTPYPDTVAIFDIKGDGIGDSLRITYNKKFPVGKNGCKLDTLPNFIEAVWEITADGPTKLGFGLGQKNASGEYTDSGITCEQNHAYWTGEQEIDNPYGAGKVKVKLNIEHDSIIVISGVNFSKDIKTAVDRNLTGESLNNENVVSWSTFEDKDNCDPPGSNNCLIVNSGADKSISDSIPAIAIYAFYSGEDNCGFGSKDKCEDEVQIKFSEPVVMEGGTAESGIKQAFSYKLKNMGLDWDIYTDESDMPYQLVWESGSNNQSLSSKGEKSVKLRYKSRKDPSDPSKDTKTPVATDSVKFASLPFALRDLAGNSPNPAEIGVVIDGSNRFTTEKVPIAELDPDFDMNDYLKDFDKNYPELGIKLPDNLYTGGKHTEFLPTPDNWNRDSVKKYYPGSVGQVFKPDINGELRNLENDLKREYGIDIIIPDSAITFHAKAYYHTNLSNYVVHRELLPVRCDDDMFKEHGEGSCRENRNQIYLAWDLKDSKGRWVGTGAYVELYDFWWAIDYEDPTVKNREGKGVSIHETRDEAKKKIEMLGVKRVKNKHWGKK